jgi:hypothetical protein
MPLIETQPTPPKDAYEIDIYSEAGVSTCDRHMGLKALFSLNPPLVIVMLFVGYLWFRYSMDFIACWCVGEKNGVGIGRRILSLKILPPLVLYIMMLLLVRVKL